MGNLNLTWVQSASYTGYKKFINGKVVYLGKNRREAEIKLLQLLLEERLGHSIELAPPVAATDLPHVLTLYEAMEQYKAYLTTCPLATAWRLTLCQRLDTLKRYAADTALAHVGYDELSALVNAIACRPITSRKTAMAPQTAINLVKAARQFFGWLEASDRWEPCRKWELVFRLRGKVRKDDRYGKIDMLTLDEFAKLFAKASRRMQCLMLTSANTGQTQSELATLLRSHVDLRAGRISRPRNKTGVFGSWLLWQRTKELLATEMDGGPLAFLTADGKPLVWYTEEHKVCAISLAWQRLIDRAEIRQIGFRSIRKLGAQLVREEGDLEIAQLFLCHKGNSLAEVHYTNPVGQKLDAVLQKVERRVASILSAHEGEQNNRPSPDDGGTSQ